MFKFLIISMFFINTIVVKAQSISSDEFNTDTKKTNLSYKELRERFILTGEIFVLSPDGKFLFQENETRMWKFGKNGDLVSNLIYKSPNIKEIAIIHRWSISNDGKIEVEIKQFDSMKKEIHGSKVTTGKLIRTEKREVKDFEPVVWETGSDDKQKVVLRLIPSLATKNDPISSADLPISLKSPVVYDNQGRLWAQVPDIEGKYIAMKTHLGLIAISFVPFKNATEIGTIEGAQINLNTKDKQKIIIRSSALIVSSERPVKIYGYITYNQKTAKFNQVQSSSSSTEKEFNVLN